MLFLVYPVNSALMTLRRLPKNFSVMTLLLATFLMLEYSRRPRRLTLAGVWLALMFSVNTNETGFAVILFVPLLWWLRGRATIWRNVNLTAIWYLAPIFKVAYFILLLLTGREFYQSGLLTAEGAAQAPGSPITTTFLPVMSEVYRRTFIEGWHEALDALLGNDWWPLTTLIVIGVGGVAWALGREPAAAGLPDARQAARLALGGLLVIIASVGILMWFPLYRSDPWRMYLVVPVGAAAVVVGLALLATVRINSRPYRTVAVVVICLLLLAPATSRLIAQLDYFTESAHRKARIMREIITLAPEPRPGTQLAIVTELGHAELGARGINELLRHDMVNSAFHVLYQENAPEYAYFCIALSHCGDFSGADTIFSAPAALLPRTLVFRLNDDLSVDLVEDPAAI